jgi:hypothetical protein
LIDEFKKWDPKIDVNFEELNETEVEKVIELLTEYKSLFVTANFKPDAASLVEHRIDTGNAKPINQPPHRVSPRDRAIINKLVDEMERDGVIQPSCIPWASPVVLVKKKDNSIRQFFFCFGHKSAF